MNASTPRQDRLYALLPAVYRARDATQGEPLRALLQVIAEQAGVIEDDLQSLYENWFIETCEDWLVPYLGELVGYAPSALSGSTGEPSAGGASSVRREVANTLRFRRRKGTLAVLEGLGRDVAGFPTHAVEFRRRVLSTVALNHLRREVEVTPDLRDSSRLQLSGGAFDPLSASVDVRRIDSVRESGRQHPANVGVYVWRLRPYSVTRAPACCLEDVGPHWFSFSALGNDSPLFNLPRPDAAGRHGSAELDVPAPIRRSALAALASDGERAAGVSRDLYGLADDSSVGQSFAIWAEGWDGVDGGPIPAERIIPANLSGFGYTPPRNYVAVDPELGRIAFPPKQLPKSGVWVSYHYGFSGDVGGGEYLRPLNEPAEVPILRVTTQDELRKALEPWRQGADPLTQPERTIIEISNSAVYVLPIGISLARDHSLELRAAGGARPIIRLLDWQTDRPDSMSVSGAAGSRFVLDGILVVGRGLRVEGELGSLTIRHSTLVPGWTLAPDCTPCRPAEPSIELVDCNACVVIDHSIVGSIQINNGELSVEPIRIRVADSVVDATGSDCSRSDCEAIGSEGSQIAHAVLSVWRSTIIGRVMVHAIDIAQDSIFTGLVSVARRQLGCMRFCYTRPGSRTPRRFECQPDLAERAAERLLRASTTTPTPAQLTAARDAERRRVRPEFTSLRYGKPGYCQLARTAAPEITAGAESESAMGVFEHLAEPQRLQSLTQRLREHVPAASNVGVILVT